MSAETVNEVISRLTTGEVATELAALVKSKLGATMTAAVSGLKAVLENKKAKPEQHVAAINAVKGIVEALGTAAEPYLVPLLCLILERAADKPTIQAAALEATTALVSACSAASTPGLLTLLFTSSGLKNKWQTRTLAFNLVGLVAQKAPVDLARCMSDVVPPVAEGMGDARAEIRKAAEDAFHAVLATAGNRDLEPFFAVLVSALARPSEVPEAVQRLSATTFVQAVETPALAVMAPILHRGLAERLTRTKRQCCVIIENMCKLVPEPWMAAPFVPKLLPGLAKAKDEVSDPDCRAVAERAFKVLLSAAGETEAEAMAIVASGAVATSGLAPVDHVLTLKDLQEVVAAHAPAAAALAGDAAALLATSVEYVASLAARLVQSKIFAEEDWNNVTVPYLAAHVGQAAAEAVAKAFLVRCFEDTHAAGAKLEDLEDDPGQDLCKCEFSLAYGGKILLNATKLHLKTGRRYGLCGYNGCGKSTLMRAIASGQLEGFPSPDELRTVYVEHDIQADATEYNVVEYVLAEPRLVGAVSREEVVETLGSVGFTPAMQAAPITSLSGGWKMKLALARAMLLKAQIMLLDEPTNHLDVTNVNWLKAYLKGLKDVTCMIVSHDSGFLDDVCTDIIHYEGFKLKRYRGNLSAFVKQKPEARAYYELSATQFTFKFPEPGFLEGVKTKDRAILKMQHVNFAYPTAPDRQILFDISLSVSLSSRVMVTGANGAGKSTMIKLLTGELENESGMVWKHPNLRIAYVAQHAFHHLEEHLDKTPSEYIQWRYATGEDREALKKASAQISEEEAAQMAKPIVLDGVKLVVQQLMARRKLRNSYEYEVQWVGLPLDKNIWLPRNWLEANGFGKMADALDAKEAAAAGLFSKPLTAANIAKHLEAIGLDQEFTLHNRLRGLSGGQKVKVVLGAAMWNNPHVLVMDEPTNYLDRDSLGALSAAVKEFGGGVVLISHNSEFVGSICEEKWHVEAGRLTASGGMWSNAAVAVTEQADEVTDAAGNTVKVKKVAKLSNKELKKKKKEREERRKRGEDVTDSEEEA